MAGSCVSSLLAGGKACSIDIVKLTFIFIFGSAAKFAPPTLACQIMLRDAADGRFGEAAQQR